MYLTILLLVVIGASLLPLALVRFQAATKGVNEIPLYGGLVKYITWQPLEGIITLRNKQKFFVDQSGQGGSKFIFSIVGDEALPRISLSSNSVDWEQMITTKESIQVTLKCIIFWKITDIYKYQYGAGKARFLNEKNKNMSILDIYESWIKTQADSAIRMISSKASVSELVSLDSTKHNNHQDEELKFSNVSNRLLTEFNNSAKDLLEEFGIRVYKIDVQSILISDQIQNELNNVWISHLKPVKSEQEAKARQIELESLAKTLGTDAVKLTEILKHMNLSKTKIKTEGGFMSTIMNEVSKSTNKAVDSKTTEEKSLDQ